ncbi:MAG: hypothetical protein IJS94_06440 [Clostridia bacterium]|nr:hypothetical protein [Clostridia bacterium]
MKKRLSYWLSLVSMMLIISILTGCFPAAVYAGSNGDTDTEYTVTFKDGDGNVLQREKYNEGERPVYTGDTPTKKPTESWIWTYNGFWTDSKGGEYHKDNLPNVTCDEVYTADYSVRERYYDINFVNYDGTVLYVYSTTYNKKVYSSAYRGNNPERPGDGDTYYEFTGWDKESAFTTTDVTFNAVYKATNENSLIRFVDQDGNLLQEKRLSKTQRITFDFDDPVLEDNDYYRFSFSYWVSSTGRVLKKDTVLYAENDETFTPYFLSVQKYYTIRFETDDGTLISEGDFSATLNGDQLKQFAPKDPEKAAPDSLHYYEFTGWTPEFKTVGETKDTTYTANFVLKEQELTYMILVRLTNGTEIALTVNSTANIHTLKNNIAKKLNIPANQAFYLSYNDKLLEVQYSLAHYLITEGSTVEMVDPQNVYRVVWLNGDGSELDSKVCLGWEDEPTTELEAVKAEDSDYTYTFTGWDEGTVDGNTKTYRPVFKLNPKYWYFDIFVRTPTGKTVTISTAFNETVEMIKERLQEKEGIFPDRQQLFFAGTELEDGRTLLYYGIMKESTLHLKYRKATVAIVIDDKTDPIIVEAADGSNVFEVLDAAGVFETLEAMGNDEKIFRDLATKPLSEFESEEQFNDDAYELLQKTVDSDMTVYACFYKRIKTVALTLEAPVIGTRVSVDSEYHQTPSPVVILAENSHCSLAPGSLSWSVKESDGSMQFLDGYFEEGKEYLAELTLMPDFGYTLDDGTVIIASGASVEESSGTYSIYVILSTGPLSGILKGDVNGDNAVDSLDAVSVFKYDAGIIDLDGRQLSAADVNNDNEANSLDATMILKYDAGIIDSF